MLDAQKVFTKLKNTAPLLKCKHISLFNSPFMAEETPIQHEVVTYVRLPYPLVTQLGPKSSHDSLLSVVLICLCDHLRCFLVIYVR